MWRATYRCDPRIDLCLPPTKPCNTPSSPNHQVHPSVAEADSLAWNGEDVLRVLHSALTAEGKPVVAAVLSGHDRGGYCRDTQGIHHVVVEALGECCPPLNAYGVLEIHHEKLVLKGESTVSSYTMNI